MKKIKTLLIVALCLILSGCEISSENIHKPSNQKIRLPEVEINLIPYNYSYQDRERDGEKDGKSISRSFLATVKNKEICENFYFQQGEIILRPFFYATQYVDKTANGVKLTMNLSKDKMKESIGYPNSGSNECEISEAIKKTIKDPFYTSKEEILTFDKDGKSFPFITLDLHEDVDVTKQFHIRKFTRNSQNVVKVPEEWIKNHPGYTSIAYGIQVDYIIKGDVIKSVHHMYEYDGNISSNNNMQGNDIIKHVTELQESLNLDSVKTNRLTQNLKELGGPVIYNTIQKLLDNIIMPLAFGSLGFFFMFMFYTYLQKIDFDKNSFNYMYVLRLMLKLVVFYVLIVFSPEIFELIYSLMTKLLKWIAQFMEQEQMTSMELTPDEFSKISHLSKMDEMKYDLMFWITKAALYLSKMYVNIVIGIRMIKIYIHYLFAPLFLTSFAHDDYKNIGSNYIRSFMALSFQSTLIYLSMSFIPQLYGSIVKSADITISDLIFNGLGYSLVLFGLARSAQQWAESMFQAR